MKNKTKLFLILLFLFTIFSCSKFELVAGNPNNQRLMSNGFIDGVGIVAKFNNPSYIAVDERNGDLYVSDQENGSIIRKIDLNNKVTTFLKISDKTSWSSNCIKIKEKYSICLPQTRIIFIK